MKKFDNFFINNDYNICDRETKENKFFCYSYAELKMDYDFV